MVGATGVVGAGAVAMAQLAEGDRCGVGWGGATMAGIGFVPGSRFGIVPVTC